MKAPTDNQPWGYDHLFGRDDYSELLPGYNDHQKESASALAERLFRTKNGAFQLREITRIVDVGCGDGVLLSFLFNELGSVEGNKKEWIGLDLSPQGIAKARSQKVGWEKALFFHVQDEEETFLKLDQLLSEYPEKTAVLIVGHTWFHILNQDRLVDVIRIRRPAMIVVDCHSLWDDAIHHLEKNPKQPFDVPVRYSPKTGVAVLRTVVAENETVHRGIVQVDPHTGNEEWQIRTIQRRVKAIDVFGIEDALETADREKTILGKCHYVVGASFTHPSGWGTMKANVLLALDPRAKVINRAWASVVRGLVRKLFVGDAGTIKGVKTIREMMHFFDAVDGLGGHREAAVILPFDPTATFAKMTGLSPEASDVEIFKHDLLLENPNRAQHRYPTAFGLFQTLLGLVSSPQALLLGWAPNYAKSKVDKEYEPMEARLLGLKSSDGNLDLTVIPVYWGSLPLFCLIVEFPQKGPLRRESVSAEVFRSISSNLHDQIKIILGGDVIQEQLIRPFLLEAVDALRDFERSAHPSLGDGSSADIARQVELIEMRLKTVIGRQSDGDYPSKPWKSWILTIPTGRIGDLQAVTSENRTLLSIWAQESERFLQSVEMRLAYWFEEAGFFDEAMGSGHSEWLCGMHLPRLFDMLKIAGMNAEPIKNPHDDQWLDSVASNMQKFLPDTPGFQPLEYFGMRVQSHFLFEWLLGQFSGLVATKAACPQRHACAELGNPPDCTRNEIFLNLKSVHCKLLENKGERVRFGLRRMHCLLTAAAGDSCRVTPQVSGLVTTAKLLKLESASASPEDPSFGIAEFIHSIRAMSLLNEVKIVATPAASGRMNVVVEIYLTEALAPGSVMGGARCKHVSECFDAIGKLTESHSPFGQTKLVCRFTVERLKSGGISFTLGRETT